jgi:hypothetical protein
MKSARTTSEAIDGLKNRLQQGIAIDSYMFEAVLEAGRPYSSRAFGNQRIDCLHQIWDSGMYSSKLISVGLLPHFIFLRKNT